MEVEERTLTTQPFIGGRVNLTGFRIADRFVVLGLTGRDQHREPVYKVRCNACSKEQPFSHVRLAQALETRKADEIILCQNPACRFSRREPVRSVTLRDVRLREKAEREQTARKTAEAQVIAEKEKAKEVALSPLREEWHRYKIAQINAGTPLTEIADFARWFKLGDSTRERIMAAIAKNPEARVTGLR